MVMYIIRDFFQGIHHLNILAGAQMLITQNKYEGGAGRNTLNDFYQTLGDTKTIGRYFYGYREKWSGHFLCSC